MKFKTVFLLVASLVLLAGCAGKPQLPVALGDKTEIVRNSRIGVGMTPLPKANTFVPGADCLLCLAAASVANSSLTTHVQSLSQDDLPKLKAEIADLMRKNGAEVKVIDEPIDVKELPDFSGDGVNIAKKDFSAFQQQYQINKLVVIEVNAIGMHRTYASYFPTSDPKAMLQGKGYMVNLKNNTYEWYQPVSVLKSADGAWDEPPKFPGLTNAYFQALEIGRDDFLRPFSN